MKRRVVITGVGVASPIGNSYSELNLALREGRHGIRVMDQWAGIDRLSTQLAAPCEVDLSGFPRRNVRSMGRVALLATYATSHAIRDAGLESQDLRSGDVGLAYGSTHGSSHALIEFCDSLRADGGFGHISGTAYLKIMSHTCAANLAQMFEIRGRVVSTCAACVSGSQAVGTAYELVSSGRQRAVIAGGAEELHFIHAGVFDVLYATSTKNDSPSATPRPFDVERDGLVVGEGAGTLVLEDYEHAARRGARIYGEVVGYGTSCDGTHVTSPNVEGMESAMRLALRDAAIDAGEIDYVNAHATATELGDIAESLATAAVLGTSVPISSTKGYMGHTLGACGAIEAILCLGALEDGFLPPSRNLEAVDPRCAPLAYLTEPRAARLRTVMSNNFAFGGINTSLLLRAV